jgi:UDP-N-acetylglucosamine 2-epimerase (non-hydrolysing)
MIAYEKICLEHRPQWIVVAGDVNSTVACAMVGAKLWIPVVHLEAGLRSFDRRMPEEINRLATDAICDVLWTPSPDADEHLRNEGVDPSRVDQVGNIMIDSYEMLREQIANAGCRKRLIPSWSSYGVVTLHRPSNVDYRDALSIIVDQLLATAQDLPLVFPVHPRTRNKLKEFSLLEKLENDANICLTEPLGYIEFMDLVTHAKVVVTDSGGVQEETTYLRIPCITLRENTERPTTVTQGSNRLAAPQQIQSLVAEVRQNTWVAKTPPKNWDGHAAERCVASLKRRIGIAS